ncbi:MAG: hypothetical protein PQJ61_14145 [Spirochaetales bacterium]|uniref:Uncharacterized protein n=1 Tax=Candidatus Thalassospirochaeta sargassi TaxID=3119039 RepID=A0AAJ1IH96_9SPIO|nr:hypothetical protein [Spirochaetales bacterium]
MRNKKMNIMVMAGCLAAVVCGLPAFASSNDLWDKAADIVSDNASVLPVSKTLTWEELSPAGDVVLSEEVNFFYSEAEDLVFLADEGENGEFVDGLKLQVDITGDFDAFVKRSVLNDGLLWTPFDDDVDDEDVVVSYTGEAEVNGTDCSVFEYTLYRDAAQYGYDFEETVRDSRDLIEDYDDPESSSIITIEGKALIDADGILRQLESNVDYDGVEYTETIEYDFDGNALYATASAIEGTMETAAGDMIVQTSFKATEAMDGYWSATDFYR